MVEKIAQKHASLAITPEMYAIVGENLLATIDELFSPGQEVIDAWAEAYGVLANVFIQREEAIYQEKADEIGGWRGTRRFKVITKTRESEVITSFVFAAEDGKPVASHKPGQYIGIYLHPEVFENREIRQYSLSDAPNGQTYRISVKRDPLGVVSNYLHDHIREGDIVDLAPPTGDFFFQSPSETPVALISGGVGQTPMMAMLEALKDKHCADVHWLHAAENGQQHAFASRVGELMKQDTKIQRSVWYREPASNDLQGKNFDRVGLMNVTEVEGLTASSERHFYLCGPVAFMQSIAKQLTDAGVATDRIFYECFGPHKVIG